jgi:hypothetical protein
MTKKQKQSPKIPARVKARAQKLETKPSKFKVRKVVIARTRG